MPLFITSATMAVIFLDLSIFFLLFLICIFYFVTNFLFCNFIFKTLPLFMTSATMAVTSIYLVKLISLHFKIIIFKKTPPGQLPLLNSNISCQIYYIALFNYLFKTIPLFLTSATMAVIFLELKICC